nr:phage tail tape measure protein [uncultured Cohaesibacter sp.]
MATKQVEARLTVKAINQLSAPLKQMGADTGKFGKQAKAEFGKLGNLRGPVKAIEDFRKVKDAALKSSRALKDQKKTVRDLAAQYKSAEAPTRKMRDELEKAQRQVKKTAAELKKNKTALGDVKGRMREFGITTGNVTAKERELASAIGKVNSKLDSNYQKFKKNAEQQKKWKDAKQQFGQSMNAATGMTATGASMTYTGQRMLRTAYDPINEAATFDEAMQGVRAVTRTFSTSKMSEAERKKRDGDYASLRDLAKRLGESTSFTNVEAANAEKFLGMAGMKTGDILSSMPSVLDLSKAGSTDLARTADISSNIMSTWGMGGSEMGHIADVMVGAFTRANVNIEQIGESMKLVGPKAKQAGLGFEYATAAIGKLGDAGLQGSLAGTGLRAVITRLAGPPKTTADALAKLGVKTKDANGNLRSMPQLLDEIYAGLQKFGTGDRAALTKAIAGEYGSGALAILLERRKEIDALTEVLKSNQGESTELAKVMMDQAKGDEAITKSAFSALKTKIGSQLMPEYRELQKTIADTLNATREWAAANPELTQTFVKLGAAVGGLLAAGGAAMFALAGVAGSVALLKLTFKGGALARGFNTFGSALDDYSLKAEKAAVKTRGLKASAKGLVGKAGLLNAVTLGFAAYETGQALSEMKRLDEMSPEEKAASKKKLDDKLASQNKTAENLPGIGWLYKKTQSARQALPDWAKFGEDKEPVDRQAQPLRDELAAKRNRLKSLKTLQNLPTAAASPTGPIAVAGLVPSIKPVGKLSSEEQRLERDVSALRTEVKKADLTRQMGERSFFSKASPLEAAKVDSTVQKELAKLAQAKVLQTVPKIIPPSKVKVGEPVVRSGKQTAEPLSTARQPLVAADTPELANLRDDLTDVDRRIAMIKQSAVSPQFGNVIAAPLMQERSELVAEIDRLTQGLAMAGLDEATKMQADGVRASGLPEALRQTAGQIRQLSFASAPDGAGAARFGAPVKVSPLTEPTLPARALGGAVKAGQTYQVNEHGRGETLVSNLSGRILSHSDSMRALRGASGASAGGMPQVHMHLSVSPQVSVDASGGAIDEASLVRLMEREMAQFANSPQMAGAMRAMLTRLWRETQLTSYQNGALV